jgi:hypothetical protein
MSAGRILLLLLDSTSDSQDCRHRDLAGTATSKQDDNDGQPERGSYNNPGTRMVPVPVVALHSPCFVPTRSIGNAIILAPVSPVFEASKYTQLLR